jgi:hypothetical protein
MWSILFAKHKLPLIVATLLGALQFHIFYRSAINLPLKFYILLEKPFDICSKNFDSFVRIEDARENQ